MSDFPADDLRAAGARAADRLARYLETLEERPVLARAKPGEVLAKIPPRAPVEGESWDAIERDLDSLVEPNLTHWQSPGFLAYFSNTGSVPGIVGDFLAAGYNQVGILWRTSPILTELEQGMVRWLLDFVGLPAGPDGFDGQLADTASTGSLIALAAAREQAIPDVRKTGLAGRPPGVVYTSVLAHSSIDKACVVLGLGLDGLRKIPVDASFSMDAPALARAIAEDRAAGKTPVAVVATVGTTSVASADPIAEIAALCERAGVWLHVDAAYAGAAAAVPETRPRFAGWERADSVLFNPHKWLFVPLECTGLFFRRMDRVRRAFSVVPAYLETPENVAGQAREYMDYGVQLGRRFRALKLWMTLRRFGTDRARAILREQLALAKELEAALRATPDVEIAAPVLFSLVVFRVAPAGLSPEAQDDLNRRILERINEDGRFFVSHVVVGGRYALRAAIGNIRFQRRHLDAFLGAVRAARDAVSRG